MTVPLPHHRRAATKGASEAAHSTVPRRATLFYEPMHGQFGLRAAIRTGSMRVIRRTSPPSPIDDIPGTHLEARVVRPGREPLLHGYDVQRDLVQLSHAEVLLTALTGEVPSPQAGAAMAIAMTFAAPISVAEAPAHAASLARRCGTDHAGVMGVAALALVEQARHLVETGGDRGDEGEAVGRLRDALGQRGVELEGEGSDLWQAIVEVFRFCGLHEPWQLECAIVLSRLPVAVAEAMAAPQGG